MRSGHRRIATLRRWGVVAVGAAIVSGVIPTASARASAPAFTVVASLPVPRSGPGVTVGGDGDIYTVGGFNSGWPIWETDDYDTTTKSWTSVAQYPDARSDLGVTTGHDGLLYAFGGQAYAFQITAEMYAYNTVTNTWTTRAPMPSARYSVGAATGPDGLIYAIGGTYASGSPYAKEPPTIEASAEVDAYDPQANIWKKVQPLPQAYRMPSAATGADGRIYVFEGCTGAGCASLPGQPVPGPMSPQLLAYDVHSNRWTQLATPPLPRTWAAMTTGADGRLYVLGPGLYVSNDNSAEVYDPAGNSWSVAPSLAVTTPGLAVATGKDGRVYAIGGTDPATGKSLTDVRTFPTFQAATSLPLNVPSDTAAGSNATLAPKPATPGRLPIPVAGTPLESSPAVSAPPITSPSVVPVTASLGFSQPTPRPRAAVIATGKRDQPPSGDIASARRLSDGIGASGHLPSSGRHHFGAAVGAGLVVLTLLVCIAAGCRALTFATGTRRCWARRRLRTSYASHVRSVARRLVSVATALVRVVSR